MNQVDFSTVFERCVLCPRRCGVNRDAGEKGFCRAGRRVEVYRAAPHFGEEPPLSNNGGSGTVFFSRCTLACCYCQNYPWSQEGAGREVSGGQLEDIFCNLRRQKCQNWNLVSPTPWLPLILPALRRAKTAGALPVVYNTSGYERVETLRAMEGIADIYLADLRYADARSAVAYSGAGDYPETARAALLEMWRQVGELKLNESGAAVAGVICRILVLPGLAEEACENLRWLAECIGPRLSLSIMSQYTPAYRALAMKPMDRKVSAAEYGQVCRTAENLGFNRGWMQELKNRLDNEWAGYNMPAMNDNARAE